MIQRSTKVQTRQTLTCIPPVQNVDLLAGSLISLFELRERTCLRLNQRPHRKACVCTTYRRHEVDITTTVIGSAPAKAVYALIGEQTNTVIKGMANRGHSALNLAGKIVARIITTNQATGSELLCLTNALEGGTTIQQRHYTMTLKPCLPPALVIVLTLTASVCTHDDRRRQFVLVLRITLCKPS